MNAYPNNRASHADAPVAVPARNPQTVVLMSVGNRTAAGAKVLRILVPINANDDSRWGVRYALHRHHGGARVEVMLLNVGEPITDWRVLRFRTQKEIAAFQSERAEVFIEEATKLLAAEHVPCRGFFKQGDIVFSILDTAEELDCDEIAMPASRKGLPGLFSRDILTAVMRRHRNVAVIAVNSDGLPLTQLQT